MAKFFFEEDGLKIEAFTVDDHYITDSKKENIPIIPFSSLKKEFNINKYSMHVALSYSEQNKLRELKFNEVKKLGYHLENYITKHTKNYLILRLTKIIGLTDNKKDPINYFLNDLNTKPKLKLADDQVSNYMDVEDLNKILEEAITKNICGIFNVGGSKSTSR